MPRLPTPFAAAGLLRRLAAHLLAWAPALVLLRVAQWRGPADDARWLLGLRVAAPFAALYFVVGLLRRRPLQRLPLGANLYVALAGGCALAAWQPGLALLARLRESALLLCILLAGLGASLWSAHGFAARGGMAPAQQRRVSVQLLLATALATGWSWWQRGDPLLAAVLPVTLLSLLLQRLAPAHATHPTHPTPPTTPPAGAAP